MNLKIFRSTKISIKLTFIYAIVFSVVLLLLNASILYGIKYYLYTQANRQIEDTKSIIFNKLNSGGGYSYLHSKELISDIPPKENIFVRVVKEDNTVLNISNHYSYNIKIKEPFDTPRHLEEMERHLVFENIKIQDSQSGIIYIQIVKDMEKEYNFLEILFVFMAAADFIGIIASILLGYIVSKRMLTPIDNITKTAQNISIHNLKQRIEIKGPDDELKRLADTLNSMIDRLQDAFDKQIQFVSDASHELRTPIAVIQGYANLLDRWGKDDREALEKSIQAIKFETTNMVTLVEKLLFLAKGDNGTLKIEKREFFFNDLIDEVVTETRLIDPKHLITNSKNDTVSIVADFKMLKQMLRIFIDNSIKFTPERGVIDINSQALGESVKITISDTGIGIPKDEIKNIFNRFYIVDKSRSKEKGGSGLGLSIAKWIIDMHQGTVNVESEEGRGTKIIVILNLS
ncbi:MAG: HAMP domain-containing sensor histidine kinase [Bacillota bacterium]|nr:HAMP domain-containing sensor histidine kinase [Bacillota bacterium]